MPGERSAHRDWVLTALDEFEGRLLHYVQRLTGGNADVARDVVQHAFLQLCDQRAGELNGRLSAWLYAVCRNRVIDLRRKDQRLEPLAGTNEQAAFAREADPADTIELRDAGELVRRAIAQLPEKQRDVVILWAEGFSYREISQITEHSEGYVRVIAHRALQALRRHPLLARLAHDQAKQSCQEG